MTSSRRAVLAVALSGAAACGRVSPGAPPAPVDASAAPAAPASTTVAPPEEELVEETPEKNPTSEAVTIKLVAEPARKAHVFWGRKDLGLAPLEFQRPRGSGPVALGVVTPGALTLHTRVYTDRDDKLALRLYGEGEAPSLLGYRPPPEIPVKNAPSADSSKKKRSAHTP